MTQEPLVPLQVKSRSGSREGLVGNLQQVKGSNVTLFPAAFGVAVGDKFDDVAAIPKGLTIKRIKRITIHYGAWIDSLNTTYVLSDDTEFVCNNGPQGGKIAQYDLAPNEIVLALGGLLGFIKNTDLLVGDLMIDYLQFHIKNNDTGEVRIIPEEPESYGSSQGADFFIQGPILAFSGRLARYLSQIQPYLTQDKDSEEFGLPQPGLAFDDRKATRPEVIQRIKTLTVRSGAWIEGLEVQYQTVSGKQIVCSHGTGTGASTSTALEDNEYIDAISICNSGPFPFCDALRFYLVKYDRTGKNIISKRTVPDHSLPAFGYEYDYGENLWIRVDSREEELFAFAGQVGSHIEELACWVRNRRTGEERMLEPYRKVPAIMATTTTVSVTPPDDELPLLMTPLVLAKEENHHRRAHTTVDGVVLTSSSMNALGNLALYHPSDTLSDSPHSTLPYGSALTCSIPSPSLPISLGRLSAGSSIGGDSIFSNNDGHSPRMMMMNSNTTSSTIAGTSLISMSSAAAMDAAKRKRMSGQTALKHGDDVNRQQRRLSKTCPS